MGLFDFLKKKKQEVSPGGSAVYRYGAREDDGVLHLPDEVGTYAQEIEAHFDSVFPGHKHGVFHEIMSDYVHIDVHVLAPTQEQPFYVVYTTGMSDLPMTLPPEVKRDMKMDISRSELYILLPGDWDLDHLGPDSPMSVYWPIGLIKFLARFPHEYKTWLAYGHTVPNGEGYDPFDESVGFGGVVLNWGDGPLGGFTAKDGQRIMCYGVIPCYKEEIEFKLKYGMDKLYELLKENKVLGMLDPQRPNLCPDFKEVLD